MTKFAEIKLTLDGVPLPVNVFAWSWEFRPGVEPGMTTLKADIASINALRGLRGRVVTLQIEFDQMVGVNQKTRKTAAIRGLTVLRVEPGQDGMYRICRVLLADSRWLWRGQPCPLGFVNWVRRLNDQDLIRNGDDIRVPGQVREVDGTLIRPEPPGGVAPVDPVASINGDVLYFRDANIKAEYNAVPRFAFNPLTLFYGRSDNGEPFRALDMALFILNGGKVKLADNAGFAEVKGLMQPGEWAGFENDTPTPESTMPVPRASYFGQSATDVLNRALSMARCKLIPSAAGTYTIGPIDLKTVPALPTVPQTIDSWSLGMTDFGVERPKSVIALLRRELTREFGVYAESESAPVNFAENVMRTPVKVTVDVGEGPKEYPVGTILPIDKVIATEAFGSISTVELRKWKFKGILRCYLSHRGIQPEEATDLDHAKAAAMESSYLKLWQANRKWMERVVSMSDQSVVVLESITGRRAAVPVWSQYAMIRAARVLARAGYTGPGASEDLWRNVDYDRDTASSPADDAEPGPFRINIVDAESGLFECDPTLDQEGNISRIFTGNIAEPDGQKKLKVTRSFDGGSLPQAELAEEYRMAAHLTTVEMDPNTIGQFLALEVRAEDVAEGQIVAKGPTVFVPIQDETARYDHEGNLVNERMVKARAFAEAQLVYQTWQDKLEGQPRWQGLHEIKPLGPIRSVRWEMVDGVFSTTANATESKPKFEVDQLLPADLQWQRLKLPIPQ